jgi:hypothetical protein
MGLNSSTRTPLSAQLLEESRWGVEGAHDVADEIDLHALPLLGDEGLRKALADLVIVQDVGLHVDVILRRQDGCVHCPIGRRAVLQQQHLVAGRQRTADDGLLNRKVAREDVGVLAAVRQAAEDRLALCGRQRTA